MGIAFSRRSAIPHNSGKIDVDAFGDWLASSTRQIAEEVTIVPIHGNHDRTEGVAATMAVGQRFHSTEDVEMMDLAERQYDTYVSTHILCMTHGDLSKKRMRKMGEIMRSEARKAHGRTSFSSVFVGHLHHKAMDMVDESGRTVYQTPSPFQLTPTTTRKATTARDAAFNSSCSIGRAVGIG